MRVTYPIEGTKAEERWKLLSLRHLPARLNAEEAGWLLGFTKEEITILVAKKILKPLGNPSISGRKSFSAAEILRLGETPAWLDKATKAVIHSWWVRNHGEPTNHVER
jgi:hypothetical protein